MRVVGGPLNGRLPYLGQTETLGLLEEVKKINKKPTVPVLNTDVLVVFRIGGRVLAKSNVLWKLTFLH